MDLSAISGAYPYGNRGYYADRVVSTGSVGKTLPALGPLLQDLVDDSVLFGLFGGEEIVTVVVALDLLRTCVR